MPSSAYMASPRQPSRRTKERNGKFLGKSRGFGMKKRHMKGGRIRKSR